MQPASFQYILRVLNTNVDGRVSEYSRRRALPERCSHKLRLEGPSLAHFAIRVPTLNADLHASALSAFAASHLPSARFAACGPRIAGISAC